MGHRCSLFTYHISSSFIFFLNLIWPSSGKTALNWIVSWISPIVLHEQLPTVTVMQKLSLYYRARSVIGSWTRFPRTKSLSLDTWFDRVICYGTSTATSYEMLRSKVQMEVPVFWCRYLAVTYGSMPVHAQGWNSFTGWSGHRAFSR
jgi:hypothetical protein